MAKKLDILKIIKRESRKIKIPPSKTIIEKKKDNVKKQIQDGIEEFKERNLRK
jgi:hypothetical protein